LLKRLEEIFGSRGNLGLAWKGESPKHHITITLGVGEIFPWTVRKGIKSLPEGKGGGELTKKGEKKGCGGEKEVNLMPVERVKACHALSAASVKGERTQR